MHPLLAWEDVLMFSRHLLSSRALAPTHNQEDRDAAPSMASDYRTCCRCPRQATDAWQRPWRYLHHNVDWHCRFNIGRFPRPCTWMVCAWPIRRLHHVGSWGSHLAGDLSSLERKTGNHLILSPMSDWRVRCVGLETSDYRLATAFRTGVI